MTVVWNTIIAVRQTEADGFRLYSGGNAKELADGYVK